MDWPCPFLGWQAFRLVRGPAADPAVHDSRCQQFVLANLSTKLQLLSSQIGVHVMRLLDVSVFLEGNVIDLGGYKLQVAEACSRLALPVPAH